MPPLQAEVDVFSRNLAERRYRENGLSDVTWALCSAVPEFATVLAAFAGLALPSDAPVRVEREVEPGAGSRVDISCSVDSAILFIEVRIHDRNYHLR